MIQQSPPESNTQCVYLLHFARPLAHARHYIGWTVDLDRRMAMHRRGAGARLPQVVQAAGIPIMLARVWPGGDRRLERRLKNGHNSPKLCPICQAAAHAAAAYQAVQS